MLACFECNETILCFALSVSPHSDFQLLGFIYKERRFKLAESVNRERLRL
jgi:hypothetical protein